MVLIKFRGHTRRYTVHIDRKVQFQLQIPFTKFSLAKRRRRRRHSRFITVELIKETKHFRIKSNQITFFLDGRNSIAWKQVSN